jgi:hypothetical protein
MGKTEIALGTTRKIKTADFEQLDVSAEIKEVIEWKNEDERIRETDKVIKHLVTDFTRAYNAIVGTIGVKRDLGTAILKKNDGSVQVATVKTDADEIDMFNE